MSSQPVIDAFFDERPSPSPIWSAIPPPAGRRSSTRCSTTITARARPRPPRPIACWPRLRSAASQVDWILETHAHADHLTAAPHLKAKTGASVVIGEHIREVQKIFGKVFNATDVSGDGREFDRLVRDGERLALGTLEIEVMHLPGHTPADVAYRIADAVFVGDTIFMPDYGTARADFPGGDAAQLYRSIRRLLALAARHPALHVPRLQGPGTGQLRLADAPWQNSVRATSMCMTASMRRPSSRCGRSAMQRLPLRSCCCRRCRSTSAPVICRLRTRTA